MNLQSIIFKLGIPTYFAQILTDIPTPAQIKIPLGKILPEQIGRIYGMSIYTDTVTAENKTLISTADSEKLYLNLKWGSSDFVNNIRLDDMLFNFVGVPNVDPQRYLPVNIPNNFNLDQSSYANPTGIVGKTIAWNLWYISEATYQDMEKAGIVGKNAQADRKARM